MKLLVLLPFWEYTSKMLTTIAEVYESGRICYISLNKPLAALRPVLLEGHIDYGRFMVIDTVTRSVMPAAPSQENCVYVSAPNAFQEIQRKLAETLSKGKYSLVVFDSVSTLLIFMKEDECLSYLKKIGDTAEMFGCEALFTALEENLHKGLVERLNYFMDRTIDMTPEDDREQP